jgi:arylsulfatase A-like enzyme
MLRRLSFSLLVRLLPMVAVFAAGCGNVANGTRSRSPAEAGTSNAASTADAALPSPRRVIVFIWDGLRPDSVDVANTPHLAALAGKGVWFKDNHSTYPTFTMMNAASFATGNFPAATGFFGNSFWQRGPTGIDSSGAVVDFNQPVFTEDYAILQDLQSYDDGELLLVGTLFQAAQAAGLTTATVGKTGAAVLQDITRGSVILDEKFAYPLTFAKELQAAGFALPKPTPNAYPAGAIALKIDNGDPTAAGMRKNLSDNATSDPSDRGGTPYRSANRYLMHVFVDAILPTKSPDLSLVWLRNPDTTQHVYGPGTANYQDALKSQDQLLGMLQDKLALLGLADSTDLIVVSDHAHSTVSGPFDLFPLRGVKPDPNGGGNTWGDPDPRGYSVSGDVRLAHLLTLAGFTAYDGGGCVLDPVLSGITVRGTALIPARTDSDGGVCGSAGARYNTPSRKVPAGALPPKAIVIAANGGSDYLYVPDRHAITVARVVRYLQSREEIGAIFVAHAYGNLPGTLSMDQVQLENSAHRNPDIIVSYNYDENAVVQGLPGIEFASAQNSRGMHGSFSPVDVHNTLVAVGPRFRAAFQDTLPSGNVDVAPTVAGILGFALPGAAGRSLDESLLGGKNVSDYHVKPSTLAPTTAAVGLAMVRATGAHDSGKTSYTIQLRVKDVEIGARTYRYFDSAKAIRQ